MYTGVSLSSSVSFPPPDFRLFLRSSCRRAAQDRRRPLSLNPSAPTDTDNEARRGGSGGGPSKSLSCLYRSANAASEARRPLAAVLGGSASIISENASSSSVSGAKGSSLKRRGVSSMDSCRLARGRLGRCERRPRGARPGRPCSRASASGTGGSVSVGSLPLIMLDISALQKLSNTVLFKLHVCYYYTIFKITFHIILQYVTRVADKFRPPFPAALAQPTNNN